MFPFTKNQTKKSLSLLGSLGSMVFFDDNADAFIGEYVLFDFRGDNTSTCTIMNYTTYQKRTTCSKSAAGFFPCSHQADIRMRSRRFKASLTSLLQVVNKTDAS